MTTTRKLRLGPLSRTDTIKLTFACLANLKADLDRYAALHAETYGEPVDAVTLCWRRSWQGLEGFGGVTATGVLLVPKCLKDHKDHRQYLNNIILIVVWLRLSGTDKIDFYLEK